MVTRFAAAVLAILLMAPATAMADTRAERLTIGVTQYPNTLHPLIDPLLAKTYVLGLARRPLTADDQLWEPTCMLCVTLPSFENGLAERYETEEGGEGVALTFEIQPAAVWGDGVPVTAKDAVFTWIVGADPRVGVSNAELFRRIDGVEIVNDKTFTIRLNVLDFDYNRVHDFQLLPAHIEQPVYEADPAAYAQDSLYRTAPETPGLWHGPYLVTETTAGARVVLDRNDGWWGQPPVFDRIVIRTIENTAALAANLLAGDIDMIGGELGMKIDQAVSFEQENQGRFNFLFKPSLFYEHIDLNLDNPMLQDVRVRQALLLAVDREAMTAELFGGYQPVAHSFVNPLDWIYTEEIPQYAYDVEQAAALLDAAGWALGADDVRRNAQGEKLALTIATTAGDATRERVQQVLQSYWRAAGIEVRIANEPARALFGDTLPQRSFDAMTMYALISSPSNVPRQVLHSEQIPTEANGFSGQNFTGFDNEAADRIIDRLEISFDVVERQDLWAELQTIYAQELPALPLYFRSDMHVLPLWLRNYEPTGHQAPTTLWVENWTIAAQ